MSESVGNTRSMPWFVILAQAGCGGRMPNRTTAKLLA